MNCKKGTASSELNIANGEDILHVTFFANKPSGLVYPVTSTPKKQPRLVSD
jgi:hypothetical protein